MKSFLSTFQLIIAVLLRFPSSHGLDFGGLTLMQKVVLQNSSLENLENIVTQSTKYLDLSFNRIRQVSQKELQLAPLSFVNLSFNAIADIEIYSFTISSLEHLDLSHNQLRKLKPLSAKPLFEFTILHLDANKILFFSEDFFENLVMLETLSMTQNRLISVNLRPLNYLKKASLARNQIESLILSNPKLTYLDVSSNVLVLYKIRTLTSCFALEFLDLSRNPIGNVKNLALPRLEELRISRMTTREKNFNFSRVSLPNLKVLDFSDNNCSSFGDLVALPKLNLFLANGNNLSRLDFTLPESLTYIGISDNAFSCDYISEMLPILRSRGIRLYLKSSPSQGSNVQGVECRASSSVVEVCKITEEDFVYAWHTSLSATVCLLLAMIYLAILWRYKAVIRKVKDQESEESSEEEAPLTYHKLLKEEGLN